MMLWPVSAVKVDYTSRNTASRSLRVDMNVIQTEARQALNKHVLKKTLELLQPMPPSWETLCYKKQHNKDFQGLSPCKWRTFYVSSGEIYTLQTCFFFSSVGKKIETFRLGLYCSILNQQERALLNVFSVRWAGSLPADALVQINQFYIFFKNVYFLLVCTDSWAVCESLIAT